MIGERFSNAGDNFSLKYKDEDGDLVTVSTDVELGESIRATTEGGCVRFYVTEKSSSALPFTSLSSNFPNEEGENSKHLSTAVDANAEGAASHATGSAQAATQMDPASLPQLPSGEKLQALLHAVVDALGLPSAQLNEYLNGLTPEILKEALARHAHLCVILRMMFLGSACGQMGPRTAAQAQAATLPEQPSRASPPFVRGWQHAGLGGSGYGSSVPFTARGCPLIGLPWGRGLGAVLGAAGFYDHGRVSAGFRPMDGPSSRSSIPLAPLGLGAVGERVSALNFMLVQLGYLDGGACHLFGPETHAAVLR